MSVTTTVIKFLGKTPDEWFTRRQLLKYIDGDYSLEDVNYAVTYLSRKGSLLKRNITEEDARGSGEDFRAVQYRLNPDGSAHIRQRRQWGDEERKAFAREVVRLRLESPHLPKSQLYETAQSVIPKNLQRSNLHILNLKWITEYVKEALEESGKLAEVLGSVEDQPVQAETQPTVEAKVPEVPSFLEEPIIPEPSFPEPVAFPDTEPAVEAQSEPIVPSVESFTLDALLGEVFRRASGHLKNAIVDALSSPEVKEQFAIKVHVHHHHHHHGEPSAVEKVMAQAKPGEAEQPKVNDLERRVEGRQPKAKIGVVTNRSDIEPWLRQAFPNISFLVTTRGPREAAETVKNCDKVIVLTKFISHATVNSIKNAVDKDKLCMLNGAFSDIKHQIQIWQGLGVIPK